MISRKLMQRVALVLLSCAATVIVSSCAGNADTATKSASTADLKYNGSYADTLTLSHTVSNTAWTSVIPGQGTCTRTISGYDNAAGSVSYQEGATICFNPGKFGKVYFTTDSAGISYYCDFVTAKTTAAQVNEVTGTPTATAPASGGCNGKAWTKLASLGSNLTLAGSFSDNFGGSHSYTNTLWTGSYGTPCTYAIIFYDNVNGFFIYQQQADAGCFATNNYKFGKVFWGTDSSSRLFYCELVSGQASYLTVANSTTKPTYTSPSTTGCGGFSWTQLTRQ